VNVNRLLDYLVNLFDWICSVSVMAVVLVILIILFQRMLRHRLKPRWQYLMWLLVIVRLALPWGPESEFSIYNWIGYPGSVSSDSPMNAEEAASRTDTSEPPSSPVYRQIGVMIWLLGVGLFGMYTVQVNRRFARRMRQGTIPVTDVRVLEIFRQCKQRMSVHQAIALVESRHVGTPTLYGFIRPQLIMPQQLTDTLTDDQLRHVFLHELAHSKRNDIRVNGIMHALLILHWFNPVLWYAYRRMREDQEIASDALALSFLAPDERQNYGYTLIQLLESLSQPVRVAGNVHLMGNKTQLQRRIIMIKNFKSNSYRWSFLGIATVVFISGCTLTNPKVNSGAAQTVNSPVSITEKTPAGSGSDVQKSQTADDTTKQQTSAEQPSTTPEGTSKQQEPSEPKQVPFDDASKASSPSGGVPSSSNDKPQQVPPSELRAAGADDSSSQPSAVKPAPRESSAKPQPAPAVRVQVGEPSDASRKPAAVSPAPAASNDTSNRQPSAVPSTEGAEPRLVPSAQAEQ